MLVSKTEPTAKVLELRCIGFDQRNRMNTSRKATARAAGRLSIRPKR